MTNKDFADLLFPSIKSDIEFYENKYPLRDIEPGRFVTRFAPSPTGVVHFGTLYSSLISKKVAEQTNGIFYLRIEDTDQKRSVENGITDIIRDLKNYEINFDEGMINETESQGEYGPYLQSQRKEIYETYAKHLVSEGLAYPCFCTEEDLENQRKHQEKIKARLGYYGKYAVCRKIPIEKAAEKIKAGDSYILRLKSLGDFDKKIKINDLIKGEIEFPENDLDIVIIKNDGLPTYHFAHAVDDHLMRTTHVIRGDEWISSLPIHLQLFQALNFKFPKYAHFSPLMKIDENGTRRKLSKRKDPEAAVSYYHEKGIPKEAVKLYVMTVANSNFEMWLEQNPTKGISDFVFDFKKVSPSGSLFDFEKLLNISKNYISHLSKEEVYQELLNIMSNDIVSWVNSGSSLLLWGERKGNGKTTMACAIANKYIREMASKTTLEPVVHFIKTARFLEETRQQFNNPTPEWPERMKLIETVPLLIIDDIGAEKPSDWVRERLLNIIDERYSNNRSIIYTSNCTRQQMLDNLHDRIYDRIRDAKSFEFKGPSWRGV